MWDPYIEPFHKVKLHLYLLYSVLVNISGSLDKSASLDKSSVVKVSSSVHILIIIFTVYLYIAYI